MILRMGLAVLVAVSLSANASQFRFHDYSESPDVAWLTVDGTQVTGDGSYGSGTIANFLITPYGSLDVGERISFDYQLTGNGSGFAYVELDLVLDNIDDVRPPRMCCIRLLDQVEVGFTQVQRFPVV